MSVKLFKEEHEDITTRKSRILTFVRKEKLLTTDKLDVFVAAGGYTWHTSVGHYLSKINDQLKAAWLGA